MAGLPALSRTRSSTRSTPTSSTRAVDHLDTTGAGLSLRALHGGISAFVCPADLPGIKWYIQHHKEIVGREPDRWASPITYASLQVLQQAIEKVGKIDRAAIIREINTGSFDTIIGKVQLKDNLYKGVWAVGQWQGNDFFGIAPKQDGARAPIVPKPAWQ